MADAKSNYLETKVVDHVLGKGLRNFTSPANLFLALHTANPGEDCTTGEVSAGGYSRQAITFAAASGGTASNSNTITFTATADWGTITHFSIWDASTAGNPLYFGALTTSKVINNTDSLELAASALSVSEL